MIDVSGTESARINREYKYMDKGEGDGGTEKFPQILLPLEECEVLYLIFL